MTTHLLSTAPAWVCLGCEDQMVDILKVDPFPYNPPSLFPSADSHVDEVRDLPFVGAPPGAEMHNSQCVGTDKDPER